MSGARVNPAQTGGTVGGDVFDLVHRPRLIRAHGALMIIAWPFLAVIGIFFASYMRAALPNGEWFQVNCTVISYYTFVQYNCNNIMCLTYIYIALYTLIILYTHIDSSCFATPFSARWNSWVYPHFRRSKRTLGYHHSKLSLLVKKMITLFPTSILTLQVTSITCPIILANLA